MVHGRTAAWLGSRAGMTLGVGACLAAFLAVTARAPALQLLARRQAVPTLAIDTGGALGLSASGRNLAAGDTVARRLTVANPGDVPRQIVLTASLPAGAPWRLGVQVARCSGAWSAVGSRLACAATETSLGGWRPLPVGQQVRVPIGSLGAGRAAWLRVTLRLPSETASGGAGRTARVAYHVDASP